MAHWYLPDGTPFYEVPNKSKGGMRDATITDARKVGAYPSVTTIIDIPRKPQLEVWKINQAILAALTNPHLTDGMSEQEMLAVLRRDAQDQAKQAAEAGTALHDAIENAFRGRVVPHQYRQTVDAVLALVEEKCGKQEWECEKWFGHELGYGGKIDLISPEWVIDFKTKPGAAEDHKMYDDQLMQLCAYDFGYKSPKNAARRKANVIVSRDVPGSVQWWEWPDKDRYAQVQFMKAFFSLLEYWQISNDYLPGEKETTQ